MVLRTHCLSMPVNSCMNSFSNYLFSKYLLNPGYVSGMVLAAGERALSGQDGQKSLLSRTSDLSVRREMQK